MAVDFPNSPTLNQVYANVSKVYKWDGAKWVYVSKDDQWAADGGAAWSTYGGQNYLISGGSASGN